ncbi:MAG: phage tail tape measure protein [Planctomycetaceae bacterium]|jgi:TP901 family phage tail tape measure protein|nr:phage tail tape measure protein [Planctomycetaceae bacterium]
MAALEAGSVAIKIIGDDKNVQSAIKRTQGGFTGMAKTVMDTFVTLGSARMAFQNVLQPLTQPLQIFAGFESGMAKVQAITGATAEQLQKLTAQAKELGKNTFFNASQVAEAQKFLGMAGFNPDQILAATPGMLDLALAGDMDLGMAADIATNISTPFGIAAERISEVNDVLAKAATSSNTNIQEMGQAFKYAAPAAAAAGQSIEECAAAMAILANNGVKADMAGTSIRQMLIKLADAGIQTKLKEQFDIDATDAAGKIRPLISVLQEMQSKMSGMTDTQKLATFYDIFEARAGTAAIVLANSGDAAADYRLKMMDAAGTTAEMARIMGDNLKGDWVSFMSAVEAVQIAFGSATGEMARDILQFVTSAARGIAELINANQGLINVLIRIAGAAAAYRAVTSGISHLRAAFAATVPAATAAATATQAETTATAANTAAETTAIAAKETYIAMVGGKVTAMEGETAALLGNILAEEGATAAKVGNAAATEIETNALIASILAEKTQTTATVANTFAENANTAATAMNASTTRTLTAAELSLATATTQSTLATVTHSVATRASAVATTAMTTVTRGATVAMNALKASFMAHPAMWIAAAVAALGTLVYSLTVAREKSAELHDEMSKQRENNDSERATDEKKMKRLQQLSEQQTLSNAEMKEAETLTSQLESKYGDLGITIDSTANSINMAADAMQNFMDVMRQKAIQDLESELKEGEKNFQELQKQIDGTGYYWRQVFGNLGLVNTQEEQYEALGGQQRDQMQKNNETRKKLEALRGGANPNEKQTLDENLAEGEQKQKERLKEIADAEKEIAKIQRERDRERKNALENEIADLKERNEEYKKHLQLLLDEANAKGDAQKADELQQQLDAADAGLQEQINRKLEKHKIEETDPEEEAKKQAIRDAMTARDDAVESGDAEKMRQSQEALKAAQKEFELTSFRNVQNALNKARDEYRQAVAEYNAAESGSVEQALAADKVNEAQKEMEGLETKYENMSETQYNNQMKETMSSAQAQTQSTFSAFEAMYGMNTGSVENDQLDELEKMNNTLLTIQKLQERGGNVSAGGRIVVA